VRTVANEIAEVNGIRLRDNLSIPTLAREMGLERSTLHRVLKTPGRAPHDTTLYRIQEWLTKRKAVDARKAARRAKRVRAVPARASA
jgi:AraC-like DNA-binding protein